MAKRAWVVRPDTEVIGIGDDGGDVEIPSVSFQALAGAVVEGATMVHRGGGVLSLLVSRAPTGFPNERVTTAAIVEWKDRTDAREQPESGGPALVAPANGNGADPADVDEAPEIDAEDPPAVDESSVPARLREG